MTEKDLFREIGMIDEKYVEEAEAVKKAKILRNIVSFEMESTISIYQKVVAENG